MPASSGGVELASRSHIRAQDEGSRGFVSSRSRRGRTRGRAAALGDRAGHCCPSEGRPRAEGCRRSSLAEWPAGRATRRTRRGVNAPPASVVAAGGTVSLAEEGDSEDENGDFGWCWRFGARAGRRRQQRNNQIKKDSASFVLSYLAPGTEQNRAWNGSEGGFRAGCPCWSVLGVLRLLAGRLIV